MIGFLELLEAGKAFSEAEASVRLLVWRTLLLIGLVEPDICCLSLVTALVEMV